MGRKGGLLALSLNDQAPLYYSSLYDSSKQGSFC